MDKDAYLEKTQKHSINVTRVPAFVSPQGHAAACKPI